IFPFKRLRQPCLYVAELETRYFLLQYREKKTAGPNRLRKKRIGEKKTNMSTTTTTTTTCVVENNNSKKQTSAPVFTGALAQVPQQVESQKKKMVRLSSLLKYSERKMAEKRMAAIAVQECDGGPIRYLHASSMVPETAAIVRDRETGALVGLPAVMGG